MAQRSLTKAFGVKVRCLPKAALDDCASAVADPRVTGRTIDIETFLSPPKNIEIQRDRKSVAFLSIDKP
jgi:hypothetical protein